ncbi:hypothetical protein HZS_7171 [Henneguya salminicola]|nr:hypothetical protein HZS_7171 [Henneguya salminicola]
MTNYIRANISTAKGKLFQNVAVDEDMLTIMDMLDYSPTFKIESIYDIILNRDIPVEKVSTALLFFLNCLPKKLVSIHTLISPDEFLDKPFDSLLSPYDYMLRHMLIFFIEISKKLPGKKLPLSELAKIVQPFIFSTESLEMLKIPKDKRKIPAYPLLKICSHIN